MNLKAIFRIWGASVLMASFSHAQPLIQPKGPALEEAGLITPLALLPETLLPTVDLAKVYEEERRYLHPNRFAVGIKANLSMDRNGLWEQLPNGDRIWRLKVRSAGALGLLAVYDRFFLPEGAMLHIYNEDLSDKLEVLTHQSNPSGGRFSTGMVNGETMILEYYQPSYSVGKPELVLDCISHKYPKANQKNTGSAKDQMEGTNQTFSAEDVRKCAINVNCPLGDDWRKEQRAVVRLLIFDKAGNAGFCTGTLVNNSNLDERPLILSAEHCISSNIDYDALQVYFNYESDNCSNKTVQVSPIVGVNELAKHQPSDLWLFELRQKVPASLKPFFVGWDRSEKAPTSSWGISHPAGEIKKIHRHGPSADNGRPVLNWPANFHWENTILEGYKEGGSSGSALLRGDNKLIGGVLSYGPANADCNTKPLYSGYGKLAKGWNMVASYLDPANTGLEQLPSFDPEEQNNNVIISEIVSTQINNKPVRYVEIYNANPLRSVGLNALKLLVYPEGNSPITISFKQDFVLAPLTAYVIANAEFDPDLNFPAPDQISADLIGDGNDAYSLFNVNSKRNDTYGEIRTNGTNRFWEYTNKMAIRRPHVFRSNNGVFNIFSFSQWELTDFDKTRATPGRHTIQRADSDMRILFVESPTALTPICSDSIAPIIRVINDGQDTVNRFEITLSTKSGQTAKQVTIPLNSTLAPGDSLTIDAHHYNKFLPAKVGTAMDFVAKVKRLDKADQVSVNDSVKFTITPVANSGQYITIEIKTNNNPEENSWEILSGSRRIAFFSLENAKPNSVVISKYCLDTLGCYKFVIFDKAGNGIAPGYFKIFRDGVLIGEDPDGFNSNSSVDFCMIPPPAKPDNCKLKALPGNVIEFSWDDNSDNEDGFEVQRSLSVATSGAFQTIQRSRQPANTTRFYDTLTRDQARQLIAYRVKAIRNAPNGLKSVSDFCTTDETVGLSLRWAGLELFPNPSDGKVELKSSELSGLATIEVFDLTGKKVAVLSLHLDSGATTLDFSHLPKGIYTLKITSSQGSAVTKLVIE